MVSSPASPSSTYVEGPKACEVGGGGMVLPLFGDGEHQWPEALRASLYGAGMVYFFIGVAIIADAFVAAIECVTARKRQYKTETGRIVTEKVWNGTVATLSLMALGSSAPEIALSVVDLFKKSFHFTPLGAQTIAGSAAFNLLVIVAVCIVIIPSSETRQVQELPAFYVTAAVSVFAYFWLTFILIIWTPDVVEVWEAVATFLFLPMLIWVSYKVDVGDIARLLARLTGKGEEDAEEAGASAVLPIISLPHAELTVEASTDGSRTVSVLVKRPENFPGWASVVYRTEQLGATPDFDYIHVEGRLEFTEDASEHTVRLEILPGVPNRVDRKFLLILEDPEGGVEFNGETDGGKDADIMTVTIKSPVGGGSQCVRLLDAAVNFKGVRRGTRDWWDQAKSSVFCLGSYEEQKEASKLDWAGHIVSLPWKLVFSLVPPTTYWGGWATFYCSLAFIGILTIFVSDLAELFGCSLGIKDDVTAIVFVALGTSMPDLFASLSAAKEEPTADASIVNVTGSNSVNVFLGLGLPWTIGAIYWTLTGQTEEWKQRYSALAERAGPGGGASFVVESGNLGFCVMVFGTACIFALLLLHLRRRWIGAELGGPFVPKVTVFAAFILYWLGFVVLASWRVDRGDQSLLWEAGLMIGGTAAFEFLVTIVAVAVLCAYRSRGAKPAEGGCQTGGPREAGGFSFRRSQSGQSVGSSSSKNSRQNGLTKAQSSSSLSEGIMNVGIGNGIGLRMLKPRFVNHVSEQRI